MPRPRRIVTSRAGRRSDVVSNADATQVRKAASETNTAYRRRCAARWGEDSQKARDRLDQWVQSFVAGNLRMTAACQRNVELVEQFLAGDARAPQPEREFYEVVRRTPGSWQGQMARPSQAIDKKDTKIPPSWATHPDDYEDDEDVGCIALGRAYLLVWCYEYEDAHGFLRGLKPNQRAEECHAKPGKEAYNLACLIIRRLALCKDPGGEDLAFFKPYQYLRSLLEVCLGCRTNPSAVRLIRGAECADRAAGIQRSGGGMEKAGSAP